MPSEQIRFAAEGGEGQGFLALPEGPGPHRAVIVIQEWWGLDEHIKDVAGRFAAEGYLALAPDLYHGAVAAEPDEARKLAMALRLDQAVAELGGAAAYLASRPDVAPAKVGAVGFCMGGSLALLLAARSERVGAVASFYGGREVPPEELARIRAPVLAVFGEQDAGIPPERHAALDRALIASGLPHTIYVYPGAPHAFFNDTRTEHYRPQAAQDAWVRTLAWFDTYLATP